MEEVTSEVSFMQKVYHSLTFEWPIIDMQAVKLKSLKLIFKERHLCCIHNFPTFRKRSNQSLSDILCRRA